MSPALLLPVVVARLAAAGDLALDVRSTGAAGTERHRIVLQDVRLGEQVSLALPAGEPPRLVLMLKVVGEGRGLSVHYTPYRLVLDTAGEVTLARALQRELDLTPNSMSLQAFVLDGLEVSTWFYAAMDPEPGERDRAVREFFRSAAAAEAPPSVR